MSVDALTCNINVLFRRGVDFDHGCDCGAPDYALHNEDCEVAPIYASTCFEMDIYPREIYRDFDFSRVGLRTWPEDG